MEIAGTPATLYRAIGDASYRSLRRHGRMTAATTVAKKVSASTAVASRNTLWKSGLYAHMALTTIDGAIMSASEPYGTRRLEEMFAAHEGSTRSKAAAKITRVEDRNRVPAHPKNHRPMTMMSRAWNSLLSTSQPANITGYGQVPTGAVPAYHAALAAL